MPRKKKAAPVVDTKPVVTSKEPEELTEPETTLAQPEPPEAEAPAVHEEPKRRLTGYELQAGLREERRVKRLKQRGY